VLAKTWEGEAVVRRDELPIRLDRALDDVGVGAVIKELETDQKAVIIDFRPVSGLPMVVGVTAEVRASDDLPHKPEHYQVMEIDDTHEWLLLTLGDDEILEE
jgi:hypothetical protein